jgi:hypothetical protein
MVLTLVRRGARASRGATGCMVVWYVLRQPAGAPGTAESPVVDHVGRWPARVRCALWPVWLFGGTVLAGSLAAAIGRDLDGSTGGEVARTTVWVIVATAFGLHRLRFHRA